jgi:hypothetical protein
MQVKYKFDPETLKKIGKSALLLVGGYIAGEGGITILQYVTNAELGKYKIPAVLVSAFLINTIREYVKGKNE